MSKLYEITDDILTLLNSSDDGELSDEQLAKLDALGLELGAKIDGCCALVTEWQSQIAARQSEVDRLRAGIRTRENNVKRLKDYLRANLEALGERKHETPLWMVYVQKSPPSAVLDGTLPPELLDKKFQRVTIEPDFKAAIEAWKAGGAPPRGFTCEQNSHLRIK